MFAACGLLALLALSGCKDKCASLSPQAEIGIDLATVGNSRVSTLRVTASLGGASPRTRTLVPGSLLFDGAVGRMVLSFDGADDVAAGGTELSVTVAAFDGDGNLVGQGSATQSISADGCNFITVTLDAGAGPDGGGGGPDGGGPVTPADIDKAPSTLMVGQAPINKIIICEVDGDASKVPDVVVAYSAHDDSTGKELGAGRVSLYHNAKTRSLSDAPDLDIYGSTAADALGSDVACADIDGDGKAELIVGAMGVASGKGRVYVFKGRRYSQEVIELAKNQAPTDLMMRIDGIDSAGDLGAAVAVANTLDGSQAQRVSLVIGAPGADAVYVVFGRAAWPATIDLSTPTASKVGVIKSTLRQASFGRRIATGKLDGVNAAVVIGAPQADNGGVVDAGAVAVYRLEGPRATVSKHSLLVYGPNKDAYFGTDVAVGDLDRDGVDDLLVGAPNVEIAAARRAGEVYLIVGDSGLFAASSTRYIAKGEFEVAFRGPDDSSFGASVAVRRSGTSTSVDLLVGAPAFETTRGAAYLIRGASNYTTKGVIDVSAGAPTQLIFRGTGGALLGERISSGVFGTKDARDDLLVTAPGAKSAYIVLLP